MVEAVSLPTQKDDARAKRAVAILVWAQSILGAQLPVHMILGGLIGQTLARDPALATLPISMTVLGSMLTAPVMSTIMARWGRRQGFLLGAAAGVTASTLAMYAIGQKDFFLFCTASLILGIYMSAHGFYRFAAADMASPGYRPKAISWVMAGGLISAVLGPQLAKGFEDALAPIPFAGGYAAMIGLNLVGVIPLLLLNIPTIPKADRIKGGRPWREILADRKIIVAMFCGMIAYALMNLVMTSTPLAMVACGFGTGDAADVVMIHVLAMFAPSFLTGPLIARFGAPRIIAIGLGALAVGGVVAISGITFLHFAASLALLGVGWNFAFIGATALLTEAHRPEERARVQGLNDFLVFGLVTVASFSSGALMASIGWDAVNLAVFPAIAVAGIALIWLVTTVRPAPVS
ncbi:MAG: MFS transporter [Pseudomonadota bacterium]